MGFLEEIGKYIRSLILEYNVFIWNNKKTNNVLGYLKIDLY